MTKYSSKDILRLHKKSVDKAIRDIYKIRPTGDPNKDFDGFHTIIEKDIAENENLYPASGPEV